MRFNCNTTTYPDINGAIEKVTTEIKAGIRSAILYTQFGSIAWEVKLDESYADIKTSEACKFSSAPNTQWFLECRKANPDYYVTIYRKRGEDPKFTRLSVTRAMGRCMLMYMTGYEGANEYGDAIAYLFAKGHADRGISGIHSFAYDAADLITDRQANMITKFNRKDYYMMKENFKMIATHQADRIRDILEESRRASEKITGEVEFSTWQWQYVLAVCVHVMEIHFLITHHAKKDVEKWLKEHVDSCANLYVTEVCKKICKYLQEAN